MKTLYIVKPLFILFLYLIPFIVHTQSSSPWENRYNLNLDSDKNRIKKYLLIEIKYYDEDLVIETIDEIHEMSDRIIDKNLKKILGEKKYQHLKRGFGKKRKIKRYNKLTEANLLKAMDYFYKKNKVKQEKLEEERRELEEEKRAEEIRLAMEAEKLEEQNKNAREIVFNYIGGWERYRRLHQKHNKYDNKFSKNINENIPNNGWQIVNEKYDIISLLEIADKIFLDLKDYHIAKSDDSKNPENTSIFTYFIQDLKKVLDELELEDKKVFERRLKEKLAEEKAAEERRLIAEQKRIAEEKAAEERRLIAEQKRIAEEKKIIQDLRAGKVKVFNHPTEDIVKLIKLIRKHQNNNLLSKEFLDGKYIWYNNPLLINVNSSQKEFNSTIIRLGYGGSVNFTSSTNPFKGVYTWEFLKKSKKILIQRNYTDLFRLSPQGNDDQFRIYKMSQKYSNTPAGKRYDSKNFIFDFSAYGRVEVVWLDRMLVGDPVKWKGYCDWEILLDGTILIYNNGLLSYLAYEKGDGILECRMLRPGQKDIIFDAKVRNFLE